MAWTAVATVVTGDIITASWGNTYVRDNTDYLKTAIDNHIADAADAHAASAITNTPAGAVVATTVQAAIDELDSDLTAHLNAASAAHAATAIANTPAGAIAATTVQAAIDELDNEKLGIPASLAQGDVLYANATPAVARLGAGTAGQFLKTAGAGADPAWSDVSLPWMIDINTLLTPASNTNFSTIEGNSSAFSFGYRRSSGAQNAEVTWPVTMEAGTWTVQLMHLRASNQGIYTVYFDAVSVGTIDGYYYTTIWNHVSSITSIAVAATAKYTLKIKMETKNGSSSSYYAYLEGIRLLRTA
jgi:hypothetical protein